MPIPMNRPGQAMTPEQMAAEQDMNPNSGAGPAGGSLQLSRKPVMFDPAQRALAASRMKGLGKPAPPVAGGPRPGFGAAPAGATPPAGAGGPMRPGVAPAGYTQGLAKGGKVSGNASGRADGCAERGKTKGRFV